MNYREECLKVMATAKHSELLEQRMVYENVVQWQPQFKGQKPYIPYYWNCFIKDKRGLSNEDNIVFEVNDHDLLLFPELKKKNCVKLKTFNGKVSEVK